MYLFTIMELHYVIKYRKFILYDIILYNMETPKTPRQPNRKVKSPSERKPNTWSSHVKQYCEDNNVKYREALRATEYKTEYYKKKNCSRRLKI